MKKNIKILYFVILSIQLTAVFSFAKYAGGSGTAEDPYLIENAAQLNEIGKVANQDDLNKHFALIADIDLSAYTGDQFNIIGKDIFDPFTGVFDGRGHKISNFTYEVSSGIEFVGLFGIVTGHNAVVKNLGVTHPDVFGETSVGALAAELFDGKILNCWVHGGTSGSLVQSSGGLVGALGNGEIIDCYVIGTNVSSISSINFGTGGLVGENNSGLIANSFAACIVDSFFGFEGVVVGKDTSSQYSNCFYDNSINVSLTGVGNITDSPDIVGKSTEDMEKSATFIDAGWYMITLSHQPQNFIWRMCTDGVYPRLNVEYQTGDFVCPDGIDFLDLAALAEEWQLEEFNVDIDFNSDTIIDFLDWAKLASAWQSTTGQLNYAQKYDVAPSSPDGVIDEKDIAVFMEYWLAKGSIYLNTDISPFIADGFIDFFDHAEFSKNWNGD